MHFSIHGEICVSELEVFIQFRMSGKYLIYMEAHFHQCDDPVSHYDEKPSQNNDLVFWDTKSCYFHKMSFQILEIYIII